MHIGNLFPQVSQPLSHTEKNKKAKEVHSEFLEPAVDVKTSSFHVTFNQEALSLYKKYLEGDPRPLARLGLEDLGQMRKIQRNLFYSNPYFKI